MQTRLAKLFEKIDQLLDNRDLLTPEQVREIELIEHAVECLLHNMQNKTEDHTSPWD